MSQSTHQPRHPARKASMVSSSDAEHQDVPANSLEGDGPHDLSNKAPDPSSMETKHGNNTSSSAQPRHPARKASMVSGDVKHHNLPTSSSEGNEDHHSSSKEPASSLTDAKHMKNLPNTAQPHRPARNASIMSSGDVQRHDVPKSSSEGKKVHHLSNKTPASSSTDAKHVNVPHSSVQPHQHNMTSSSTETEAEIEAGIKTKLEEFMKLLARTRIDGYNTPRDTASAADVLFEKLVNFTNETLPDGKGRLEMRLDGKRREVAYYRSYQNEDLTGQGEVTLYVKTEKKDSSYFTIDPWYIGKSVQGDKHVGKNLRNVLEPSLDPGCFPTESHFKHCDKWVSKAIPYEAHLKQRNGRDRNHVKGKATEHLIFEWEVHHEKALEGAKFEKLTRPF